jgi:hypothetical protein
MQRAQRRWRENGRYCMRTTVIAKSRQYVLDGTIMRIIRQVYYSSGNIVLGANDCLPRGLTASGCSDCGEKGWR